MYDTHTWHTYARVDAASTTWLPVAWCWGLGGRRGDVFTPPPQGACVLRVCRVPFCLQAKRYVLKWGHGSGKRVLVMHWQSPMLHVSRLMTSADYRSDVTGVSLVVLWNGVMVPARNQGDSRDDTGTWWCEIGTFNFGFFIFFFTFWVDFGPFSRRFRPIFDVALVGAACCNTGWVYITKTIGQRRW